MLMSTMAALFYSLSKRKGIARNVNNYVMETHEDLKVPYRYTFRDSPGSKSGVCVATGDDLTVAALQTTIRMTELFRQAMATDPLQDGVQPWEAVIAAAEARNGGVKGDVGGSGFAIVTDSRTNYYTFAASAAIAALTTDDLPTIISYASNASGISPIDVNSAVQQLRMKRGKAALELANGPDVKAEDAELLCQLYGEAQAWDTTLAEKIEMSPRYVSLTLTHSAEMAAAKTKATKAVLDEIELLKSTK